MSDPVARTAKTPEEDPRGGTSGGGSANDEAESPYEPGRKEPLDHGAKVRGKVKRGTGTRDQDELLIEGRGEDAAEAAADFEAALREAEERQWASRLRALQPDDPDEDEEGEDNE